MALEQDTVLAKLAGSAEHFGGCAAGRLSGLGHAGNVRRDFLGALRRPLNNARNLHLLVLRNDDLAIAPNASGTDPGKHATLWFGHGGADNVRGGGSRHSGAVMAIAHDVVQLPVA